MTSPLRMGSLDRRRRRRIGLPQGRGRWVLGAFAVLAVLYVIGLLSGDGDTKDATPTTSGPVASTTTAVTTTTIAPPTAVAVTLVATKLPAPLSRTAATADGATALVLGGRTNQKASVNQVLRYDPLTGVMSPAGTLSEVLHDAAAVTVMGKPLLVGGGDAKSTSTVHAIVGGKVTVVGRLPEPRADLMVAAIGDTLFVVGGYDGAKEPTTLLASSDGGATFRAIGALLNGNRYGMLVAVDKMLYLIGGEENGVPVAKILRIDPVDGSIAQIGTLPAPLSNATAFVLEGGVFVAGGRLGANATDQILRIDLATGAATPIGTLPEPVANASVAVVGDAAYLFGGEAATAKASVVAIRAVR